jgi:hypothetical protein
MTGFVVPLFKAAVGSNSYMTTTDLDSMVGDGVWVLVTDGTSVSTLRSVSTDNTSLETFEDNITVQIDYFSQQLRNALRPFLAGVLITNNLMKYAIAPVITSVVKSNIGAQIIGDAKVIEIKQSETSPDTIEIVVDIVPLYSLNVIRVTLYI